MLRANNQTRLFQKRTIRPLYGWHSAVPYACFLDTAAVSTTVVYPGQVAVKTTGEQMDYSRGGAGEVPFGLFNNFINGDMDDLGGGTEIGVWTGSRDSVFEILAGPSVSETPLANVTWTTLNATRGGVALYADANGRLTNVAGGGLEVARLIEAVSNTKIIVQLVLRTS
jgi:hypothetical protein